MTNKKLHPLDNARELGNSITESKEYKNLIKAEEDFHNDSNLQNIIKELKSLESISKACGNNHERLMYLDKINELKQNIEQNDIMNSLTCARTEYDKVIKNVNNIVNYIIGDESRVQFKKEITNSGCGGCSGCHNK